MSPIHHSFYSCPKPHQLTTKRSFSRLVVSMLVILTAAMLGPTFKAATIVSQSSTKAVEPILVKLEPQGVCEYQITFQSGPNAIVGFFKGLDSTPAEDFSVKEYDEFHRVLHPLEHEALPKNDMATIRRRANELIKLGEAIVKLGVPEGTKSESVENFKKELEKFKAALAKYGSDAESGSDADLKKSYSAVHDSFEELAGMLPRK